MEINAVREYLELLKTAVSDKDIGAEIQETEDGPVLLFSGKSPFDENEETGYQLSLIPADNGIIISEVLIFLINGIKEDKFDGVNTLIARINPYLRLGSFRFFEDNGSGSVIFAQGTVLDEELDIAVINSVIGKTVSIMENTVLNAGEYIYRYVKGEKLGTLLEEIDREED